MTSHRANLRLARTKEKVVPDPLLNRMGLQVARTAAARANQRLLRPTVGELAARHQQAFRRDGIVVIEDFVPATDFDELRRHALNLLDSPGMPIRHIEMGGNQLDSLRIDDLDEDDRAGLGPLLDDPRLWELVSMAGRRDVTSTAAVITIDRLRQLGGAADPESELHSDTFFSTVKCWLYLNDVVDAAGPLEFVPQSHRLSPRQLGGVYRHSLDPTARPSRRIPSVELESRGLSPRRFTCGANTFVIADTFGYHRRAPGTVGATREAIHVQVRANPFRR